MNIRRDDITIRSAKLSDAEVICVWWNDGKVMAHAGYPLGLEISIERVEAIIAKNETKLSQCCVIELNEDKIGECNYSLGADFAEIGIKICESKHRNKGIGTLILKMLIDFIFSDYQINYAGVINKIILDTNAKNLRAQHVYEKIGFDRKRTNIDVWKNQLGEYQTSIDYELTRQKYLEQKK